MSDISSFAIQNPKQISNHLSLLVKNKCLLNVHFGANDESYITTLLEIHEGNNAVVLDCGPKEYLNHHMLNAGKVVFETEYKGIKVSFVGDELKKITYKGEPAFSMPIPKAFSWRERREYYRVKLPLAEPSHCQLAVEDREPVNLKLYDLSLTGFAMVNIPKDVSDLLVSEASFQQCKLVFSGAEEITIPVEIRYDYIINPDKLQKVQKVGCKFSKMTCSVENAIQRYMQRVQREDLQKEIHVH